MDFAPARGDRDAARAEAIVMASYAGRRRVESIGRALGLGESDLPDLMQRVVLTMYLKHAAIRTGAERAFLSQVARLEAGHMLRARRRRRETELCPTSSFASPPRVEEDVALRRALRQFADVFATTSEGLREVWLAHVVEGKSCHSLSQSLGLPIGTVKSRLRRSRAAMSRVIAPIVRARSERLVDRSTARE